MKKNIEIEMDIWLIQGINVIIMYGPILIEHAFGEGLCYGDLIRV